MCLCVGRLRSTSQRDDQDLRVDMCPKPALNCRTRVGERLATERARPSSQVPIDGQAARRWVHRAQRSVTALILFGPHVGIIMAGLTLFGSKVTVLDLALLVIFYAVSGHGMTAGFHRLLTHRSFKTRTWVKLALVIAGSLAMEGTVNGWVANHRRHHVYADRDGDPHSPYAYGTSPMACARGALHAHVGWLFQCQPSNEEQ